MTSILPSKAQPVSTARRLPPGIVWSLTAILLLSAFVPVASAQFNGPAPGVNGPTGQTSITTDQAILFPPARDLRLHAGDLLQVRLYGAVDYNPIVRVSLDGTIQLPLIGVIPVDGLNVHQAEDLIADALRSAGMYRSPQITITVTESPNQVATVTGEMHGVIPIIGQRRLLDVLAAAGGLPATASHTVTINRPGLDQAIVVNLGTDPAHASEANIPIFPGDTIIIARTGVVYILGAFKLQGAIPIQSNTPLTLMQVAALSNGPGYEGRYNDLRIIRTVGAERKVVRVDIAKVINGKSPDPVLQPDDIVFLPTNDLKAAIKGGGIGTLTGLVSLLVVALRR